MVGDELRNHSDIPSAGDGGSTAGGGFGGAALTHKTVQQTIVKIEKHFIVPEI